MKLFLIIILSMISTSLLAFKINQEIEFNNGSVASFLSVKDQPIKLDENIVVKNGALKGEFILQKADPKEFGAQGFSYKLSGTIYKKSNSIVIAKPVQFLNINQSSSVVTGEENGSGHVVLKTLLVE